MKLHLFIDEADPQTAVALLRERAAMALNREVYVKAHIRAWPVRTKKKLSEFWRTIGGVLSEAYEEGLAPKVVHVKKKRKR